MKKTTQNSTQKVPSQKQESLRQLVQRLADLSMLNLTPEEQENLPSQFDNILRYIEKLGKAPITSKTPETDQVTDLTNVFRKDKIKKSLSSKEALSNAKYTQNGFFKVPKVL